MTNITPEDMTAKLADLDRRRRLADGVIARAKVKHAALTTAWDKARYAESTAWERYRATVDGCGTHCHRSDLWAVYKAATVEEKVAAKASRRAWKNLQAAWDRRHALVIAL